MSAQRDGGCTAASESLRVRNDAGATLLLALLFLVAVSLVVIGLVRWTGNDLANTSKFVSAQSFQSASNSANQLAIQFVRYNFIQTSLNGAAPASCWTPGSGASSETALNGQIVDSWCMTRWYPGISTSQRVVTVSTCRSTVSAVNCALQPLLQTIVTIGDGGSSCFPVPNATSTPNTCGKTVSISDWQFGASPPVITLAATGSFTCASGTPVTVTGTNLALATNVDFLDPSTAGSPGAVWAPGTMASGATSFDSPSTGATTIQACSPSVLSSYSSLYVIVSTPMGSNQYGASALWAAG